MCVQCCVSCIVACVKIAHQSRNLTSGYKLSNLKSGWTEEEKSNTTSGVLEQKTQHHNMYKRNLHFRRCVGLARGAWKKEQDQDDLRERK